MFFRNAERIATVEKRLAELEQRLGELGEGPGDLKSLELEFEELKDKVLRWMQRANARKRSDLEEPQGPQEPEVSPRGSYLERMDPISRRIHERRLRGRTSLHLQPGVGVVAVREEE